MANKTERDLFTPEMKNKTMNSFREFLNFTENLLSQGLIFEKKVTKFSKTSAAIYLPKRLIGKKFKVFLMPIDDGYEVSDTTEKALPDMSEKAADKLVRDAEKDLEKIQKEEEPKRINLMAPIL
jgi:hypothetical protein